MFVLDQADRAESFGSRFFRWKQQHQDAVSGVETPMVHEHGFHFSVDPHPQSDRERFVGVRMNGNRLG